MMLMPLCENVYCFSYRRDLALASPPQIVVDEDGIPIEQEEEVEPGNVYYRPELDFQAPSEEGPRAVSTLYDCISNGRLDLNRAARLILDQKPNGTFRQATYDLTDPPQRIQEYSVRLHGKSGRANSLLGFPPELENLLLDFGEDLIGYGQNELKEGAVVNPSNSSFFMGLGNTHKERQLALEQRTDERIVFRSELFRALQLALRDIRSYEYDVRTSQWRANDVSTRSKKNDIGQRRRLSPGFSPIDKYTGHGVGLTGFADMIPPV
ncbi:hypothetical protein ANCCAN_18991 [Ancylostoma caninum]|uniref:Uncharacterized protein n=1 Tax=Ancylostoma caninum TaxID=29170 RepID=A0A368FXY5_ANCCA|nr:hypothetical protein ANCCAN_18991 [Ancylostoma caninum]